MFDYRTVQFKLPDAHELFFALLVPGSERLGLRPRDFQGRFLTFNVRTFPIPAELGVLICWASCVSTSVVFVPGEFDGQRKVGEYFSAIRACWSSFHSRFFNKVGFLSTRLLIP